MPTMLVTRIAVLSKGQHPITRALGALIFLIFLPESREGADLQISSQKRPVTHSHTDQQVRRFRQNLPYGGKRQPGKRDSLTASVKAWSFESENVA